MSRNNIITNGMYKHFKGREYQVLFTANDSRCETYVVYADEDKNVYARPEYMFFGLLDRTQYPSAKQDRRFEFTGNTSKKKITDLSGIVHTEEAGVTFKAKARGEEYILIRQK